MTDLDQRIASALRERAEGEIDTHRLLRTARARGRRRQLRRRAATGTALALVGVLGFVGVTGTDLAGISGRLPWTAATPAAATPVPPRAEGVPGAIADPARVATDPTVLHFGLRNDRARYLGWTVRDGLYEQLRFRVGNGQPVSVEVSRDAQLLNEMGVDGFPIQAIQEPLSYDGTVRSVAGAAGGMIMSWRPAPDLYARASTLGSDRAGLSQAVQALRWDEARRCASPLRLTALPAGARVAGCSVDVTSFPQGMNVDLTLLRGDSGSMDVRLAYAEQIADVRSESNRRVGGRPAYLYPKGDQLELLGIPKAHLIASFGWPAKGFTEADAATVLAGARLAEDVSRPGTWK